MLVYVLLLILFCVGLYGVLSQKNLIKIVLGIAIIEHAVNLFLVAVGYRPDGAPTTEVGKSIAPVRSVGESGAEFAARAVDPLPQAMVLTAVVIGLAVLVLLVTISLRLYQRYKTYDVSEMRRLRG
ncbi:MAG: sodium:proton antiporter [Planctomycetota bacterium]|jgi:multisubunit Na+/H+ antiporter MnhC subunit